MIPAWAEERLEWLQRRASDGLIHTVRVSFGDRLGHWRGKRVPVDHFLVNAMKPVGFCNGMLVCDVRCDIIEETPFSNYGTGYPDMHVRPSLDTLREVGWARGEAYVFGDPCDEHGRPVGVSPRVVLRGVVERLRERGLSASVETELRGRLMYEPDTPVRFGLGGLSPAEDAEGVLRRTADGLVGSDIPVVSISAGPDSGAFCLRLGRQDAAAGGEATLVAKGALKEVAQEAGMHAVFMTMTRGATSPSLLHVRLGLEGKLSTAPSATGVAARLNEVRALLQPSITAFKIGAPWEPSVITQGNGVTVQGLAASSEADPITVVAATLAAVGAALEEPGESSPVCRDLATAAEMLVDREWPAKWLGDEFVANAAPLLSREASLFRSAVTDWEIDRYWGGS